MERAAAVVILAAGEGKRMRSAVPKVLHPVCGRPLVGYVVDQARSLAPERTLLVLGAGADRVREGLAGDGPTDGLEVVVQAEQRGTGHAVQCALPALEGLADEGRCVVVLYGDMPALRPESLATLVERFASRAEGRGATFLTAEPEDSRGYGRILRGPDGSFRGIVEERDASAAERAIREVNVGVYAFPAAALRHYLPRLRPENAQGELYLTDVAAMMLADGLPVVPVPLEDPEESQGVNTLRQLASVRATIQERILERHLDEGVLIEDPATTYVDDRVAIGRGTRILPCTVIRAGVVIGEGCEVGPFTHLRAGSVLEDGAEVGNFTEAKKARVGAGSKAKHLSYLGDVAIGRGANIGAGTIVANYDGKVKHDTSIGDRAFVGSGSILIAPTRVGNDAITGAGAVVTRNSDVADGDTWVGLPARPLRSRGDRTGGGAEGSRT